MSILDRLRGRPSPALVHRLIERAVADVDVDPAKTRETLEALGSKPWRLGDQSDGVGLGISLRARASWRLGDELGYQSDARLAVTASSSASSLLPIALALAVPSPSGMAETHQLIADRYGCCAAGSCGHNPGLEAALAIIREATEPLDILRWSTTAPTSDDGEAAIQIAAYVRLTELKADEHTARRLLDNQHPRLIVARAGLAYREGRYTDVMGLVSSSHCIAHRAALALVARGDKVDAPTRDLAEELARSEPIAEAILAEADGRHADAADAWEASGYPEEARVARFVDRPLHSSSSATVPPSSNWYAYAVAGVPRPRSEPESLGDIANDRIGRLRGDIAGIGLGRLPLPVDARSDSSTTASRGRARARARVGRPDGQMAARQRATAATAATHVIIDNAHLGLGSATAVLSAIQHHPAKAADCLAIADQDAVASSQLHLMADSLRTAPVSAFRTETWAAWRTGHGDVVPLPRPVDPTAWLGGGMAEMQPRLDVLAELSVETRTAVLAGLIMAGDSSALGTAIGLLESAEIATITRTALPELAALAHAVATRTDAKPVVRRRAAALAASALAHRMTRRTADEPAVRRAVQFVSDAVADLHPDPAVLTAQEAFEADFSVLEAFTARLKPRALGPVMCLLTGTEPPGEVPGSRVDLYERAGMSRLLLRFGRPDEARMALQGKEADQPDLAVGIAASLAERHLAANRPFEALHELADVSDLDDLLTMDGDLIERMTVAVVRGRGSNGLDQAIEDAENMYDVFEDVEPDVVTMYVELLLRRVRDRPGSLIADIPDLERVHEIDPKHPVAIRQLAHSLVTRAMETVEDDPEDALRDVDRATDMFMGDADFVRASSRIATHAAVIFMKKRSPDRARRALDVALAIDPQNSNAKDGRRMILMKTGR